VSASAVVVHAPTDLAAARALARGIRRAVPRSRRPRVEVTTDGLITGPTVLLASPELTVPPKAAFGAQPLSAPQLAVLRGRVPWEPAPGDPPTGSSVADGSPTDDPRMALPEPWVRLYPTEPRWVNLRGMPLAGRGQDAARFRDAAVDLAGPIVGMTKEELVRAEAHRLRRVRALLVAGLLAAMVAIVVALVLTRVAAVARQDAIANSRVAQAQVDGHTAVQTVSTDPRLAFLLAAQQLHDQPNQPLALLAAESADAYLAVGTPVAWPEGTELTGAAVRSPDGAVVLGYRDGTVSVAGPGSAAQPIGREPALVAVVPVALPAGDVLLWSPITGQVRGLTSSSSGFAPSPLRLPETTTVLVGTPDPTLVVTGDQDGSISGWDLRSGARLWRTGLGARVLSLAVSPTGASAVVGTDDVRLHRLRIDRSGASVLVSVPSKAPDETMPAANPTSIAIAGSVVAVGGSDGGIRFFDAATLSPRPSLSRPRGDGAVTSLAVVGDRVIGSGLTPNLDVYAVQSGQALQRWRTLGGPGVIVRTLPATSPPALLVADVKGYVLRRSLAGNVEGIDVGTQVPGAFTLQPRSSGRAAVAVGLDGGRPTLWVAQLPGLGRSAVTRPVADLGALLTSTLEPDDRHVVLQATSGRLVRWDSRTSAEVPLLDAGVPLDTVTLSPDGHHLIGITAGQLLTWTLTDTRVTAGRRIPLSGALCGWPVWLDDHLLAMNGQATPCGTDELGRRSVDLVDVAAGTLRRLADIPQLRVLAASPDRSRLAAGAADGTVTLIDTTSGATRELTRTNGSVSALVFLDRDRIAFGTGDRSVRVIAIAMPQPIELAQGSGTILSILDLGDGRAAVSDLSGRVTIWTIDPAAVIARGCARLGRPFTSDEARTYGVPDGADPCRES
jgi:WD40 repeat protein